MQNDKQTEDKSENKKDVVIIRYNPRTKSSYNFQTMDAGENGGEEQP